MWERPTGKYDKTSRQVIHFAHLKKFTQTVKPVLSGHSNIDKTKILMTNCSLMKVKSIAECSPSVVFLSALRDNWSKNHSLVILRRGHFGQVFLYVNAIGPIVGKFFNVKIWQNTRTHTHTHARTYMHTHTNGAMYHPDLHGHLRGYETSFINYLSY